MNRAAAIDRVRKLNRHVRNRDLKFECNEAYKIPRRFVELSGSLEFAKQNPENC
jgi:hypothetical protein